MVAGQTKPTDELLLFYRLEFSTLGQLSLMKVAINQRGTYSHLQKTTCTKRQLTIFHGRQKLIPLRIKGQKRDGRLQI